MSNPASTDARTTLSAFMPALAGGHWIKASIVNDDGSLGANFDWVDLTPAWNWLGTH